MSFHRLPTVFTGIRRRSARHLCRAGGGRGGRHEPYRPIDRSGPATRRSAAHGHRPLSGAGLISAAQPGQSSHHRQEQFVRELVGRGVHHRGHRDHRAWPWEAPAPAGRSRVISPPPIGGGEMTRLAAHTAIHQAGHRFLSVGEAGLPTGRQACTPTTRQPMTVRNSASGFPTSPLPSVVKSGHSSEGLPFPLRPKKRVSTGVRYNLEVPPRRRFQG